MSRVQGTDDYGEPWSFRRFPNTHAFYGLARWEPNRELDTLLRALTRGTSLRLDWRVTATPHMREAGLELHEAAVTTMSRPDPTAIDAELGTYRLPSIVYRADSENRMIRKA